MFIGWLGHATVAIEMDGATVLTDPVLAMRVGHLRRVAGRGAAPGRPDAILVSHLHRDHLDLPTLRRLDPAIPVVAPAGSARLLRRAGRREIVEVVPGDVVPVGPLRVVATPAEHPGGRPGRGAAALRRAPVTALGFVVQGSRRAYFAGDTGLFPEMEELSEALDLALLPVGGWHPRLGPGHLDAERAAQALVLLRPRVAIPVHWGTYAPPGMRRDAPHLREQGAWFRDAASRVAPEVEVRVLAPGDRVAIPAA